MSLVDANVILRYLLDDHAELSVKAANILENHTVTLPVEVGCEVVYVLQKVYNVSRKDIESHLKILIADGWVVMERPAIFLKALEIYGDSRLDFVDAILLAYGVLDGQEIFTFDRALLSKLGHATSSATGGPRD